MLNLIYNNFNCDFSVLQNKVKDKIGSFNSKKVVILTGLCISVSLLAFAIIKKFTKNPTPSQQTKQPISNSDTENKENSLPQTFVISPDNVTPLSIEEAKEQISQIREENSQEPISSNSNKPSIDSKESSGPQVSDISPEDPTRLSNNEAEQQISQENVSSNSNEPSIDIQESSESQKTEEFPELSTNLTPNAYSQLNILNAFKQNNVLFKK